MDPLHIEHQTISVLVTTIRTTMSDDGQNAVSKPKVHIPDTFDRQCSKVKAFLLQCNLYLELCEADFGNETNKVYFAVALLRGPAADWAEFYIRDRLDNIATAQRLETYIIFSDFDAFKQVFIAMFGNTEEDCRAAIELINLKQTVLVVAYTAKFQQLHTKAE